MHPNSPDLIFNEFFNDLIFKTILIVRRVCVVMNHRVSNNRVSNNRVGNNRVSNNRVNDDGVTDGIEYPGEVMQKNLQLALWRFLFACAVVAFPRTIGVIVISIAFHELGHYFAFKCFHVYVYDVGVGIGPTLFSYTDSVGTVWTLGLIPLAGYVQPCGAHLSILPLWKRITCFAAGPLVNFCCSLGPFFVYGLWNGTFGKMFEAATQVFADATLSTFSIASIHHNSLWNYIDLVRLIEKQALVGGIFIINSGMLLQNLIPFPPFDGGQIVLTILRSTLPSRLQSHALEYWVIVVCAGFLLAKMVIGTIIHILL